MHMLPNLSYEISFQMIQKFLRKSSSQNFEIWVTFGRGQRMTLTFDTRLALFTHLVECINQL